MYLSTTTTEIPIITSTVPFEMVQTPAIVDIESGVFEEYDDLGFDIESQMSVCSSTASESGSRIGSPMDLDELTPPSTPRNTEFAAEEEDQIVWTPDPAPVRLWTPPITNTIDITTPPRLIRVTNSNFLNRPIQITPRNLMAEFRTM